MEAAMKLVGQDVKLANFYQRIRRRSGSKIARVAAARKLAEICWKRLRRWHRMHDRQVVRAAWTEQGTLRRAAEKVKERPAKAYGGVWTRTAIMNGQSSPMNLSMCDGASRTARMGDRNLIVKEPAAI